MARGVDHGITVSWRIDAEGAVPTEFWVQVGEGLERTEDTSLTVLGLRNGQEYEVVVYSATADGRSAGSDPVRATPLNGAEGEVAGLIVEFAPGVADAPGTQDVAGEQATNVDMQVSAQVSGTAVLVELDEPVSVDEAEHLAVQLEADPRVEWAEPDQFLFTSAVESGAWNLAGDFGVDAGVSPSLGEGATVAVIDTGVTSHPELDSRLVSGFDFVSSPEQLMASRQPNAPPVAFDGDYADTARFGQVGRDANPSDPGDWREVAPVRDSSWHGTQVAGVISSVVPGAKVQPIRALSWRGGLLSDIAASITWASGGEVDGVPVNATPSKVINMSFSTETMCPVALQDAIDAARAKGSILVAAAGNAGDDASKFAPGNCQGVITVAATTSAGTRAAYSNYGPVIDLAAPGGDSAQPVPTSSNTGTRTPEAPAASTTFGTSIAAAHVSAGAAMLAATDPALTPDDAYRTLTGRDYVKDFAGATCDANPQYSCGTGILSLAQIASVASGDEDYAMTFSKSSSQYAYADGGEAAFQITGSITIQAWVKANAECTGDAVVLRKKYDYGVWCGGTGWYYTLGRSGSTPLTQYTGQSIAIGQWQHIALTRAAGQDVVNFYVNGQLAYTGVTGGAGTGNIATSSDPLEISSYLRQYAFFPGQIDEVRLFNTARTAAQIVADMHTYGPVDTSGLVAYYDFNEGPAGTTGTGTVYNRASGASSATNLRTVNSPTYADIKQTTSNGSNTVVTFPRSYLTAAGGWRAPSGVSTARAVIVGGGGGGAGRHGGGGGAGGVIDRFTSTSVTVVAGTMYPITVGQGGLGASGGEAATQDTSTSGQDSVALGFTAGGGGRGDFSSTAGNGASGGGSMYGSAGTANGVGAGNAGGTGYWSGTTYAAGGGGGAGNAGSNASSSGGGSGGSGVGLAITGTSVTYGRGGAGGYFLSGTGSGAGADGTPNLGNGGGGGGGWTTTRGGRGGSGVVIVSYVTPASPPSCTPLTYVSGAYTVVEYQGAGTCSWTVPSRVTSVDVLAVGGGGGGGSWVGGGGGGGGVLEDDAVAVTGGSSVSVTVGAGGAGAQTTSSLTNGSNGGASSFGSAVTALGGGVGASNVNQAPGSGSGVATGGGGAYTSGTYAGGAATGSGVTRTGGSAATDGQPHAVGGGAGAGGNGFSGSGSGSSWQSGAGGIGVSSSLTGATVFYGGGGGGSAHGNWPGAVWDSSVVIAPGPGGRGGGGLGSVVSSGSGAVYGFDGTDGLGGGGGGAANFGPFSTTPSYGGDGGDGVVIVRYFSNWASLSVGGGQQPGTYTYGTGWVTAPKVQLVSADGTALTTSGVTVTATFTASSGSAALGSATAVTNSSGVADFTSMTVTGNAGTAGTLTFSASGYGSVTSSSFSIAKAPVTVTADAQSVAYGTSAATVTGAGSVSYNGFKGSDTSSVVTGSVTYTTTYTATTAAATSGVTITPVVTALSATNYTFAAANGTVTVTKANQAALTLTSTSGTYGTAMSLATSGGTTAGAVTYVVANGTASTCAESGGSLTSSTAGTCTVTATMAGNGNYNAVSSSATTVTLAARPLTMSGVTAVSKAYDGNRTATLNFGSASLVGVAAGDTSSAINFSSASATGEFASAAVANNVAVTVTGVTLTGTKSSSYSLTQPTGITANITSASRTLSFATTTYGKTYGDAAFTVTATPSAGSGTLTYSATGSGCSVNSSSGLVTISSVGACSISASIATDGSYDVASTTTPVSVTVNAKPVTITGMTASNKEFDDTDAATVSFSSATVSGVVGSDSVSIDSSGATATFASPDVNTSITVTAAGVSLSGTDSGNYVLSAQPTTTANITTRALVVTAGNASIAFGASTPTPSVSAPALQGNDAIGSATYTYAGTGSTTYAASSTAPTAVGTYSITPSAAVFSSGTASNYSIVYTAGTYTITKANQTITFASISDTTRAASPLTIAPTASSGLTVTVTSLTTSVCTVSGSSITLLAVGTCTLRTSQAGNASYEAATAVDQSFTVNPGTATALVVTGSASQTAGGTQTVTITAVDSNGDTATDYTGSKNLTFSGASTGINGSAPTATNSASSAVDFGSTTALTFTSGVATTSMVLYRAETATVAVTDGSISASGSNRLTVTVAAGAAAVLNLTRQSVGTASGAAFTTQPQVTIQDSAGNTVTTDSSTVITATVSTGGSLVGTATATAMSGEATFTNLGISGTSGTAYTVTYSSGALTSATQSVTVSVGAAATVSVSAGNGQSATAGSAVATPPAVLVTDSGGNPVSGTSVTFAVASGGGSGTSLSATSNSSGIATVGSWTLGAAAGANTMTATAAGLSGSPVTFTATGTAGAATKLQVLLPGETATPGVSPGKTGSRTAQTAGSATTVTVNAVDANWNVVSSATPTVAITSSDTNASLPSNAALTAGTGTFSVTFKTADLATVTATDQSGALTASTSGWVTVNAGTATKLQVLLPGETAAPGTASGKTGTPTAQTAGSGMSVTVNAVDANWNKVTTQTQTVAITSSDSAAALPSNAALVSGTKNFTVTLKTSGSRTVTASVASGTALTAGESSAVTVNPATAATISVTTSPTAGASGSVLTQAPVVGLRDAYNNANATYAYDVTAIGGTVSSNLATLSGPKKVLYADGIWMAGTNWTNSSGALYMSRDGVSWTSVLSTTDALSFGYGNGTWTAFIANRRYTSTDGFTWTSAVTSSTEFFDVAYGNGVWVGTRTSGATVNSADGGLTWSTIADLNSKSFNRVEYVNTRFFAYRTVDGHRYTSTDGTSWTAILGGPDYCYGFAYANGRYVQVGHSRTGSNNGSAYYSADGITFTAGTFPTESNSFLSAVSSSGDRFMAAGQYAYSSVDGITWVRVGTPSAQPTGLAYGNGMWLGVNSSNVTRFTDSVTGTLSVTPSSGSATFSNLTVNGASGTAIPIYFGGRGLTYTSANVTPTAAGPPARLVLTRASVGTAYGAAFTTQPQVTVQDAAGSTLSSNNSTVVTATVSSGGSVVGTATATAVNGVATFTDLGISGTVGTKYEVVYSSGSLATTSQLITVTAGPPSALVLTRQSVGTAAGAAFTTQPQVTLQDANGNTVTTDSSTIVTASISSGGTLVGTTTATASSGVATFSNLGISGTAGSAYTITYSSGSLPSVTQSVTVTVGSAAAIAVSSGNGQSATAGSAVATPPAVLVTDSGGNPVQGRSVTFAVASGGGSGTSLSATTNASGIATVGSWTLGGAAGSNTMTATSSGLSGSPVTFTATGTAGNATKLQVLLPGETAAPGTVSGKTGAPTAQTAGSAVTVTVNAVDANWNVVTTATPTIAITSSDTNASLPSNAALTAGTNTFSVTFKTAGSRTVTATDQAPSGALTASTSTAVTVNAGTATKLQVLLPGQTADPGSSSGSTGTATAQTAGSGFFFTVNAVDAYWNKVTSATQTIRITSSDSAAVLPSNASLSSGTATFAVTLKTAGSKTVTATVASGTTLTAGSSSPITVNGATATVLTFQRTPSSSGTPGTALATQPLIGYQDAYGNTTTTGTMDVSANPIAAYQQVTGGPGGQMGGIAFGDGRWVSAGYCVSNYGAGCIYSSGDGVAWSTVGSLLDGDVQVVAYGNGTWLIVAGYSGQYLYRSTDGFTWTRVANWSAANTVDLAYGGGTWIAAGRAGQTLRSTDGGLTWSTVVSLSGINVPAVAYGNSTFVVAGENRGYSSTDGTTWTYFSQGVPAPAAVEFGNGRFVIAGRRIVTVSGSSTAYVSIAYASATSLSTWSSVSSVQSVDCWVYDLTWTGGMFVTSCNGGFFSSTNGATWAGGANQRAPIAYAWAGGDAMALGVFSSGEVQRVIDPVSGTTTVSPSGGTATFTDLAVNGTSGSTVSLAFMGGTATSVSRDVTITGVGPAYRLRLTTASVGTASGAAFTTQPAVTVTDISGNVRTSDNSTVVTATASSGGTIVGTATATAVNGVATFSNLGLSGTVGTSYEITYSSGNLTVARQVITVTMGTQTITWGEDPSTLTYGDAPFTVSATASSGGAVTFSSRTSSVCTVSGSTVTIVTAGTCTVRATQAGTASVASTTSDRSFTINQAAQAALTLTSTSGTYGTALTLATSGGTTAGALSYAVASGTATGCAVSSGALTSTSAGTCTVTATMAGNTNYTAVSSSATTVTLAARPLTIDADDEAIVFGNAISQSYTLTSGSLAYSDAIASVTYTYTGTGSTIYGPSTTAPTGAGTYSVTPSAVVMSPGSATSYDVAYTAGAVTIGQASQTITFAQPSGVTYGVAPFALSPAPSSSSGLPVTVTSNDTDVCAVASGIVTVVGAGTCSLTAAQAGNADYAAASSATQTFAVAKATQAALAMSSMSSVRYGETITLASTGGSGTGAVAYSVDAGTCTIASGVLSVGNAGSLCQVKVTNVGDANYDPRTSAAQTITIAQAGQTLAFTSTVPASPLPNGTYTPAASAISTVTGNSSGVTPTFATTGTCSISGGVVTFTATGTCTITASAASSTNFTAATDVTQVIAVGSLNQNITFAQPSNRTYGASSFALGATTSSNLDVSYTLGAGTTNSSCAVSVLGVVTILDVGTCEVVASQAGDAQYASASSVTRAFQIAAALPTAPTLTSASASSQSITVGFVAPGFSGAPSVSVTGYQLVATPTGSGTTVTSTACTTSPCTISGLVNGTEYTVTVAAINFAGTGSASSASTALTPATAAYAVGALAATPGNTTVTLTWTALTNAQLGGGTFTRYEIYMRVPGVSWSLVSNALTNQSADNLTIPGLDNGTSYDFKVVAITSANGGEIPGNTAEVVQYPSTVPTAPRSLSVLASTATDVQFSWVAPLSDGGAALTNPSYAVTVTGSAGAAAVSCTPGGTPAGSNRFCTASNLTNGASYTFSVVATNRMGGSAAATTTYSVPSSDATLSALEVEGTAGAVALSPAFSSGTMAYTASVVNGVTSVTVTPTSTMAGSAIEIDGAAVTSGSASAAIPLAVGPNVIDILVTASDPRFDETYTITITRAPAPGGGSSGFVPSPGVPQALPASLVSSGALGAVVEDGIVRTDVALVKAPTNSGWSAVGSDFQLTVLTETASGSPEQLGPGGAMRAPQGGLVVINGDGYEPSSEVAVFAIPDTGLRMVAKNALRSVAGAVYLGSAPVSMIGTVAGTFRVPTSMRVGDYVLQVNGVTTAQQLRSVNLQCDVLAAPVKRAGSLRDAAFFEGAADRFSATGLSKLRAMVAAIPTGAEGVRVTVVGVSTALDTPKANLTLARDRAQAIVDYLEEAGVKGSYTVSVSTNFDVRTGDKTADAVALGQPMTSSSGKPLTTVGVSFTDPGP